MADDYFTRLGKGTQPFRDAFAPKKVAAPKPAAAPKPPEAPKPMTKAGELQGGESIEDYTYMRSAQEKINKKLAPKSVMGKSSSKR
jgi:hypothetical protein